MKIISATTSCLKQFLRALPIILVGTGTAWALSDAANTVINDPCAFTALMGTESGGQTNIVNPNGTAAGISQVTLSTMGGLGAVNCTSNGCPVGNDAFGMSGVANRDKYGTINSSFFGDLGINNWNDYLSGPNALAAQQKVAQTYFSSTLGALDRSGTVQQYAGNSNNALGINMNSAAMMQCANAGVGICPYILSNGASGSRGNLTDAQVAQATAAIRKSAANYNPSGNCTPLGATAGQGNPNQAPQQNVGEGGGLYCDPQILSAIQSLGAQEVDARMALAMDPRTGFTTLNGQGVLGALGLSNVNIGGAGSSGTSGTSSTSFFSMSCIDKILNSGVGGLNNIFNPPSWSQIQDMLLKAAQNFICSQAQQLFQQFTQPLNQALYKSTSLDGFAPGMGSMLGQLGLPSSLGLGGRVAIIPGPSGALVPLEDRFNLMMGNSSSNSFTGSGGSGPTLPSRLLGQ